MTQVMNHAVGSRIAITAETATVLTAPAANTGSEP